MVLVRILWGMAPLKVWTVVMRTQRAFFKHFESVRHALQQLWKGLKMIITDELVAAFFIGASIFYCVGVVMGIGIGRWLIKQ